MLVDTCAIIDIFKNNQHVFQTIRDCEGLIYVSTTVLGELYYGALHSKNRDKHLKQIKELLITVSILNTDNETALQYAVTREALTQKGKLIPSNDIWIAAIAIQHKLSLFTRDAHFKRIENLDLIFYQ